MRVAGLARVEGIHGLENIDVTKLVNGHMAYRSAMPKLLREVGWEVESDTFTEIEDPDPENHQKRQRELIRELDDARKEAEAKPKKKRFGLFSRGRLAEKNGWETYDEKAKEGDEWSTSRADGGGNVLFDIEAIKAELASEQVEVKQLESTLPPMQLNVNGSGRDVDKSQLSPYSNLRETKSYDASMALRSKDDAKSSQSSFSTGHKDNPFNQGYDEYNISAEAINNADSADHGNLSFESTLQSPSPPQVSHVSPASPRPSLPSPESGNTTLPPPPPPPQRPPLRSSLTMPPSTTSVSLEHNAWVDEEDEDFGKEKNVELTFG